jgi:hypothetical protein
MTFSSQFEARQFLIDKITAQASRTATPLSEAEKRMLQLNLEDPGSAVGIPVEVLEDKNRAFESKAVRLLKAAYNRDRDNAQESQRYKNAVLALRNTDHYILMIATASIPVRRRWGQLLVYLVIILAMVAMIVVLHFWTRGK